MDNKIMTCEVMPEGFGNYGISELCIYCKARDACSALKSKQNLEEEAYLRQNFGQAGR